MNLAGVGFVTMHRLSPVDGQLGPPVERLENGTNFFLQSILGEPSVKKGKRAPIAGDLVLPFWPWGASAARPGGRRGR